LRKIGHQIGQPEDHVPEVTIVLCLFVEGSKAERKKSNQIKSKNKIKIKIKIKIKKTRREREREREREESYLFQVRKDFFKKVFSS